MLGALKILLHSIMWVVECIATEDSFETVSQLADGCCSFLVADWVSDRDERLVLRSWLERNVEFRVVKV